MRWCDERGAGRGGAGIDSTRTTSEGLVPRGRRWGARPEKPRRRLGRAPNASPTPRRQEVPRHARVRAGFQVRRPAEGGWRVRGRCRCSSYCCCCCWEAAGLIARPSASSSGCPTVSSRGRLNGTEPAPGRSLSIGGEYAAESRLWLPPHRPQAPKFLLRFMANVSSSNHSPDPFSSATV
jgi:hypothetical protein